MIVKREKRKRLFYVPGMISLVLIPVFCFYHFYKVDAFKVYGGINLGVPEERFFLENKILTRRNYKTFNLNKSESANNKVLNDVRFDIRELVSNKDTINGVIAHFGSNTNYEVFINLLDMMEEEKVPIYSFYKNDFYMWGSNNAPKKVKDTIHYQRMNCNTSALMAEQRHWELKNKREEEEKAFQLSFFQNKWEILSLGYLGLVLLNIFVLVKFNKNK